MKQYVEKYFTKFFIPFKFLSYSFSDIYQG